VEGGERRSDGGGWRKAVSGHGVEGRRVGGGGKEED